MKETPGVFVFDQRTKAVMAQAAQDGIKEKLSSVREVVPGHSNNEITLVLQYYDYSVERTIQAYLEDGAKEALQEWHFPGNKEKEKKKKLKKKRAKEARERREAEEQAAAAAAARDEKNDDAAEPAAEALLNGDADAVFLKNGDHRAHDVEDLLAPPSGATSLPGATSTSTGAAQPPSSLPLESISQPQSGDIKVSATETHEASPPPRVSEALPPRERGGGGRPRGRGGAVDPKLELKTDTPPLQEPVSQPVAASQNVNSTETSTTTKAAAPAATPVTSAVSASTSTNSGPSVAVTRPNQPQKYQTRPKAAEIRRQVDHSHHSQHVQKHTGPSNASSVVVSHAKSTAPPTVQLNMKRPYAGLEKSVKDLHRQTLALTRIKMTLADEMERCYKMVTRVFEDLNAAMNEREADLIFEMDKVKDEADRTLQLRQRRAAELKQRTERAAAMSDTEVAALRHDIKVFVSDRKIDEELGSTQRLHLAAEELMRAIRTFGEVAGVRSSYGQRRNSVSSVSSSCVSHDELMSPTTPLTPLTPATPITPVTPASADPPGGGSVVSAPLPRVQPTRVADSTSEDTAEEDAKRQRDAAREIEDMKQKFQDAFKAPLGKAPGMSSTSTSGVSSSQSQGCDTDTSSVHSLNTSVDSSSPDAGKKSSHSARRRKQMRDRDRAKRTESGGNSESAPGNVHSNKDSTSPQKGSQPRKELQSGGNKGRNSSPSKDSQTGTKQNNRSQQQHQSNRNNSGRQDNKSPATGRDSQQQKMQRQQKARSATPTPSTGEKIEKSVTIHEDAIDHEKQRASEGRSGSEPRDGVGKEGEDSRHNSRDTSGARSDRRPGSAGRGATEQRSQSQPGTRRFDRRDRSASARGRPRPSGQGGFARGASPSKRGGGAPRQFRGGYQNNADRRQGFHERGEGDRKFNSSEDSKKSSSNQDNYGGGDRRRNNYFEGENRKYQDYRSNYNPRGPRPDSRGGNNRSARYRDNSYNNRDDSYHSGRQNAGGNKAQQLRNSSRNSRERSSSNSKPNEVVERKELASVAERKKEDNGVPRDVREASVETTNTSKGKSSVQENAPAKVPKTVNRDNSHNHEVAETTNSPTSRSNPVDHSVPKVDENSNHKKASVTATATTRGRLTNGSGPHEVSINDAAPVVKKSVVSVEEVTRKQDELEAARAQALPQRKPRMRGGEVKQREVKRAEVIVNGDLNGVVNGHMEE